MQDFRPEMAHLLAHENWKFFFELYILGFCYSTYMYVKSSCRTWYM